MERGVVFGHSLLGYDLKNGRLTVKEDEAALVCRIFRLYGEEGRSTGEIAALLSAEGVSKPDGSKSWDSRYILRILKNEKYVGDLVQKKSYTPDFLSHEKRKNHGEEPKITLTEHHEAVIDRPLWNKVQFELSRRSSSKSKTSCHHAFSGKIRCGTCGADFVARYKYRQDGKRTLRWRCASAVRGGTLCEAGGCKIGRLIRNDDVKEMLHQALVALQIDFGVLIADTARIASQVILDAKKKENLTVEKCQQTAMQLKQKKAAVLDAFFSGAISNDEMQDMRQYYDAALRKLEDRRAAIKRYSCTEIDKKEILQELEMNIASILSGNSKSDLFFGALLSELIVYQDRHTELTLKGLDAVFFFQ